MKKWLSEGNRKKRAINLLRACLAAGFAALTFALAACTNSATSGSYTTVDYLYAADFGGNAVSAYSVNLSTGALTPISSCGPSCTKFTGFSSDEPDAEAAFPSSTNQGFLYVTVYNARNFGLEVLPLASSGIPDNPIPDTTGSGADGVAIDPSGTYVYVANWNSSSLSVLSAASGGSIACSACSGSGLSAPTGIAIDPEGDYLYVANSGGNTVSEFKIESGGALSFLGTIATGEYPTGIAISSGGKYLYVANNYPGGTGNSISEFSINRSTGLLSSVGSIPAGPKPMGIAIDPLNDVLYAANSGSSGSGGISAFSIDSSTGALTSLGSFTTGDEPKEIAFSSTGQYLYVTNYGSNSISEFSVDSNGTLSAVGTAAAGSEPLGITTVDVTQAASY